MELFCRCFFHLWPIFFTITVLCGKFCMTKLVSNCKQLCEVFFKKEFLKNRKTFFSWPILTRFSFDGIMFRMEMRRKGIPSDGVRVQMVIPWWPCWSKIRIHSLSTVWVRWGIQTSDSMLHSLLILQSQINCTILQFLRIIRSVIVIKFLSKFSHSPSRIPLVRWLSVISYTVCVIVKVFVVYDRKSLAQALVYVQFAW